MIKSVEARTPILALILFVFGFSNVFAENNVVVILMAGDVGVSQWERVEKELTANVPNGSVLGDGVSCGPNKRVMGGGINSSSHFSSSIINSYPVSDSSWVGGIRNTSSGAQSVKITIYAICAKVE